MHRFWLSLCGTLAVVSLTIFSALANPALSETGSDTPVEMEQFIKSESRSSVPLNNLTEQQTEHQQQTMLLQPSILLQNNIENKRYLFEFDQTLALPKNSISYSFFLPQSLMISSTCKIKLYMTCSQTLIDDLSSLTLFVNGTPIASMTLVEEATLSFDWDVSFSKSLVRLGEYNEIKLITVQRSIEGDCADIDNPSNWIVLHKSSYLVMQVYHAMKPPLSDFYRLFFENFTEQFTISNEYILSDPADPVIIETMLNTASIVGMHYPKENLLSINVFKQKGQQDSNTNKIIIEKEPQPSAEFSKSAQKTELASGEGSITFEGANDQESYYKLNIVAKDSEGFTKAISLLSDNALLAQVQSDSICLSSSMLEKASGGEYSLKTDTEYSLFDLGYTDIKFTGAFHQRITLSFPQRAWIKNGSGSYLDLHFKHSAALLSDRSQLTISINGTPMDSVKLSPGNVNGANLRVFFPESALDQPMINVDIEVYHYLGKVDCTKDYYDVAWTVIDTEKSTVFFKQGLTSMTPTLNGFPYFYNDVPTNQVAIVLSPDSVQTATLLSTRASQNIKKNIYWHVQDDVVLEKTLLLESDLVFLVDKRNALLPKEISDKLIISVKNGDFFIQDKTIGLIPDVLEDKAVIQVLRSPWNFYRSVYVLFYDGIQGLMQLNELLSQRDYLNQMSGQLCLIGKNIQVQSFSINQNSLPEDELPKTIETYIQKAELITGLPIWAIACFTLLLLILVLLIVLLKRQNKEEYKKAIEQLKYSQKTNRKVPDSESNDVKKTDGNE